MWNVTQYLIKMSSLYTKESVKAYKSLKVFDDFVCGHVQQYVYHDIYSDCTFFHQIKRENKIVLMKE